MLVLLSRLQVLELLKGSGIDTLLEEEKNGSAAVRNVPLAEEVARQLCYSLDETNVSICFPEMVDGTICRKAL